MLCDENLSVFSEFSCELSDTEPTEISHDGRLLCIQGNVWGPDMIEVVGLYFRIAIWAFGIITVLCFIGMIIGMNLIKKAKRKSSAKLQIPINQIPQNGEELNDQEKDQYPI